MPIGNAPSPTRTPRRQRGPYERGRRSSNDRGRSARREAARNANRSGYQRNRDAGPQQDPPYEPPRPPAPLLPPAQAGALAALAGMWGLMNPPKGNLFDAPELPGDLEELGWRALNMQARLRVTVTRPAVQNLKGPAQLCAPGTITPGGSGSWNIYGAVGGFVTITGTNACGNTTWMWGVRLVNGGTVGLGSGASSGGSYFLDGWQFTLAPLTGLVEPIPAPVPLWTPFPRAPAPPFPFPTPDYDPQPLEEPPPTRKRPPVPAPPEAPPEPEPLDPETTPGPGPAPQAPPRWTPGTQPRPIPVPLPVPTPQPPPVPDEGQQTGPDGRPVPVPPPDPKPLPPSLEDFLGETIGQPGTAPPPTLPAIAQEVGKLEQKLRIIGTRQAAQGSTAGLEALEALLEQLLNLLLSAFPGGSYVLESPCPGSGSGGQSSTQAATWGGGVGRLVEVSRKLDAIAELIQIHKDMRQPVCATKASGEEVTVIFEEI